MNSKLKNILKILLFSGISVGLIYLILRGITPEERESIKKAAAQANYFWVVASILVAALSHYLRALRWKMLIEPTGYNVGTRNTFFSLMIGYLANYIPPRVGEVIRCVILSRYEKVPFPGLLGTVIVERIVDTLSLGVLFLLMMLICFNQVYKFIEVPLSNYFHNKMNSLAHMSLLTMAIIGVVIAGLVFVFIKKKKVIWDFAGKYIKNFWDGLKSIGKLKKPMLFWVYSLAIWVCYLVACYLCFFCFSESSGLSLIAALVVLVFGTFGVIITPGGTGAYQIIVIKVLTRIFLISFPISFTLAWIIWGSQLVLIVLLGVVSLLLLPILNKNEEDRAGTVQNT